MKTLIFFVGGFCLVIPFLLIFILTLKKSDMKTNKYGPIPDGVRKD